MAILWKNSNDFIRIRDESIFGNIATRLAHGDISGNLFNTLPNPDEILRSTGNGYRVWYDLLSDPHVAGAVDSRKSGVLSLLWGIDRDASPDSPQKESEASIVIRDCFARMDLRQVISEILNATLYGYQPIEITWEYYPKPGAFGEFYILPKALVAKPPEWFQFDNATNNLVFISRTVSAPKPVPPRKFLVAQFEPSYINPYGNSILSRCYWSVTFKRGLMQFAVTFAEKYGMPWAMIEYNRNSNVAEVQKTVTNVANAIQDAVLAVPTDYKASLLAPPSGQSIDIYQKLINFFNDEISKAILGHTGSIQSTPGKLGSETAATDARSDKVQADKALVESVMNRLIGYIYELNFATVAAGERPTFAMYAPEDVDQALADRDTKLFNIGIRFSPDYIANAYDLPITEIWSINPPPAVDAKDAGVVNELRSSVGGFTQISAIQTLYFGGQIPRNAAIASAVLFLGVTEEEAGLLFPPIDTQKPVTALPVASPVAPVQASENVEPEFADLPNDVTDLGQDAINVLSDVPPDRASAIMSDVTRSALDILSGAESWEDARAKLAAAYTDMDTASFRSLISSALFMAKIAGRLTIQESVKDGK